MSQIYSSDTALLASIASGDSAAIKEIYELYHSALIKWICTKGGEEADAEDVFQDALIVLYEKAQDSEFCLTCKISTYIFAVCKRLWLKKAERRFDLSSLKQDNEEEGIQLQSEEVDVQRFLTEEAHLQQLEVALKELGEPCASLLSSFYWEQKSMKEIAERFNYTNPENAKTQKYKCLSRLRKLFFKQGVAKSYGGGNL